MPRAGVTAAPLPVLSKGRGGRGENAGAAVTSSNAHARTSTGTSLSASAPASARATSSAPTRPSSAVSLHYVVDTTRRLYKERQYLTADICANVQLRERLAELNGELAELHGMARVVDDMDAQVREFGEEMVGMLGSVVVCHICEVNYDIS